MKIGTPSNLELLLHCYYSTEPHPRLVASAIQEGITFLLQEGMIKETEYRNDRTSVYKTTEKAMTYIQHLLSVPFPVPCWLIPV